MRSLLTDAQYSLAGIRELGVDPGLGVRHGDVPVLRHALRGDEPLATLVRLFLFADAVGSADVDGALGAGAALLEAAGLVEERGGRLAPLVSITPWRDGLVVHDRDPAGELWRSHVSGPTPAAEALASLVIAEPVDRALDIGTGAGLLAVGAARQARQVVATDVNPIALQYAHMTALLSDAENVETREGDLFDPVRDERFGLIVSNPPFVISPQDDLVFRHSPMARDELSATVVRETAHHLGEGGFGVVTVNWIQRPGDGWLDVPAAWLDATNTDAIVLLLAIEEPLGYAVRWNLRQQQLDPSAFPATIDAWLDYYRRENIEAIASGAVVLRHRATDQTTAPRIHGLELTAETRGSASAHLLAVFDGLDYLAADPSAELLLATRFAIPATHRLDQSLRSQGPNYIVDATSLSLEDGLGIRMDVDPELVPILLRLDGSQPLGEAATEVAELTGTEPGTLADRSVAFVRDLLERGMAVAR